MKHAAFFVLVFLAATPALAAPMAGSEFLTAAGLTPTSTLADAQRLYGKGEPMGPDGIRYFTTGSQADAWLTFKPGKMVYVDCDEVSATLPADSAAKICAIATASDWKKALGALDEALAQGTPTNGAQYQTPPEEAEHAPGQANDGDDDDDDDNSFVEVARTFHVPGYTVTVETCPRIKTRSGDTWHAGVVITWTPA
jgi:hypothetical protein